MIGFYCFSVRKEIECANRCAVECVGMIFKCQITRRRGVAQHILEIPSWKVYEGNNFELNSAGEEREKEKWEITNPLKVSVSMINLSKKNANFSRRGRDIDTT